MALLDIFKRLQGLRGIKLAVKVWITCNCRKGREDYLCYTMLGCISPVQHTMSLDLANVDTGTY